MDLLQSFPPLNLPPAELKIRRKSGRPEVFDPVRRIFTLLSPEEWVRQHFIAYLMTECQVPPLMMSVEKGLSVQGSDRRFDLVVFNAQTRPAMLVECKAAHVPLSQSVLDQAGVYNTVLKVPFLCVTNGIEHICCKLQGDRWDFLDHIPHFSELHF